MTLNEFLNSLDGKPVEEANKVTEKICGITHFFESGNYQVAENIVQENKVEYGDWQTSLELACKACLLVKKQGVNPDVIIEPTCGTGTFILASIIVFGDTARKIFGIEICKPYLDQFKFRLLDYGLKHPGKIKATIHLVHQNIFNFDFDELHITKSQKVLIVGNPPWVTNSKLGEIKSHNVPQKSNFKNVKGMDAITGKANFDIAEYITCQLLAYFHQHDAWLAFLIKSSVAKNIVLEQRNGKYSIESMTQFNIDAKKEFNVSVAACLFVAKLGNGHARQCTVTSLYHSGKEFAYGWVNQSFVSNVKEYSLYSSIDGKCPLTWWSGMKHDCSMVMELEKKDGKLYNNLKEVVEVEPDLIYPLLKSSDLKDREIASFRKYVIVTQKRTSDDTSNIKDKLPRTYKYLEDHIGWFDKRGSIIYRKRPKFSIFGIGKYSFHKYKIAIAGLYKNTTFSLVCPMENKCVMLDDTCYLLGFDSHEMANCFIKILNSPIVQSFLQSLVFPDAKRCINKDLLMRIDIEKAANLLLANKHLSQKEYDMASRHIHAQQKPTARQYELHFQQKEPLHD